MAGVRRYHLTLGPFKPRHSVLSFSFRCTIFEFSFLFSCLHYNGSASTCTPNGGATQRKSAVRDDWGTVLNDDLVVEIDSIPATSTVVFFMPLKSFKGCVAHFT